MDEALPLEERRDCFILRGGYWFRLRAAAVILRDGHVLMAEEHPGSILLFGGRGGAAGRKFGGCRAPAVLEETGVAMEVDRLLFIHENFFPGENGAQCHEIAFYYPDEDASRPGYHADSYGMGGIQRHMVWLPIAEYANYHAYPRFFKDYLDPLPSAPQHICSWEGVAETRHGL